MGQLPQQDRRQVTPRFLLWLAASVVLFLVFATSMIAVVARWDSYRFLHRLWPGGLPRATAFSPDSTLLITTSWDEACVWDVRAGERVLALKDSNRPVGAGDISFSPDGKFVLRADGQARYARYPDKTCPSGAYVHNARTGELLRSFELDLDTSVDCSYVSYAFFSPCQTKLVFTTAFDRADGQRSSVTAVWDIQSGERRFLSGGATAPWLVLAGGDLLLIASGSRFRKLDLSSCTIVGEVEVPVDQPTDYWTAHVSYPSPDGSRLLVAAWGTTVREFDLETGEETRTLPYRPTTPIWQAWYSPDGRTVLSYHEGPVDQVWDAASGHMLYDMPHGGWCPGFSNTGARICTQMGRKSLSIVDATSGIVLREFTSDELGGLAGGNAFSSDNPQFSVGDAYLVIADRSGYALLFRRTRPEWWWGHFCRVEVWIALVVGGLWLWSAACLLRRRLRCSGD